MHNLHSIKQNRLRWRYWPGFGNHIVVSRHPDTQPDPINTRDTREYVILCRKDWQPRQTLTLFGEADPKPMPEWRGNCIECMDRSGTKPNA